MNESKYFLPYQIRWLKDNSQIKIWEKSRRIGATYIQSYEDTRDAATGAVPDVYFSSADESAAKEYIKYVEQWAKLLNVAAESLGEIVIDKDKDIKALSVKFANGVTVNALTSNPKRFRSKGGKVILDEFAHHEDPEELWKAAKPCVMWGWPIRILSTHNKKRLFYKFIQLIKKGKLKKWRHHFTDIYTAVKEGLLKKILKRTLKRLPTEEEEQEWLREEKENCADPSVWKQEYECIPEDDEGSYLSYEMLQRCEKDDVLFIPLKESFLKNWQFEEEYIRINKIPIEQTIGKTLSTRDLDELLKPLEKITGELYAGWDIAKSGHLAAIWVFEKIGSIKFTRACIVTQKVALCVQTAIFSRILSHPRAVRGCIDKKGMGEGPAEKITQKFPGKAEAIDTNGPAKYTLATGLYYSFQGITIFIPEADEIRDDLISVQKSTTPTGAVRLDAEVSNGSHADRFWACALANHAASLFPKDTDIRSGGKRKMSDKIKNYSDLDIRALARLYGGR